MTRKPTLLVILDGFGSAPPGPYNAISQAQTPHLRTWFKDYPCAYLKASGTAVGLPFGYIGNSEVGHETIGAGRIIQQPLTIINNAIKSQSIENNKTLAEAFQYLACAKKPLHIMGLLSDAGVHSHVDHLYAFIKLAKHFTINQTYLHLFLDGRDVPPQSASHYLKTLETTLIQEKYGTLASLHGRFYAMDRDKNWDRTEKSYRTLTYHKLSTFSSWQEILNYYYNQGITDEFIPPTQLTPEGIIKHNDGILCFNFRPDRIRQLTACFLDPQRTGLNITPPQLSCFISPYPYASYLHTQALFEHTPVNNTLKEVLAAHHKKMFTIAETEKYAHVTYFFNGEKEEPLQGETRVMISSIKAKTYVEHPCMKAPEITDAVIEALHSQQYDFYLINYANADMVGHSGNVPATIQAIECLDQQLKRLYDNVIKRYQGTLYITADHGKAEQLWDEKTNQPCTAHTTNLVPFLAINQQYVEQSVMLSLQELSDIAPYILKKMGLFIPHEMNKI
jgi:2,3-bisphosphoglycerate-independent phosphoglycerate mutase